MKLLRYKNLFSTIKEHKPQSLMEIGVYDGRHAVQMIETAQIYHKEVNYYGFDLFELITPEIIQKEFSKHKIFSELTVRRELEKTKANIYLYKGFTKDTLSFFVSLKKKVDFIFVDGGHSLETVQMDWCYIQEILKVNQKAVVLFDDYYCNTNLEIGSRKLIDGINQEKYKIKFLTPVDKVGDRLIQFVKLSLNN
jgi:hypothetical protein